MDDVSWDPRWAFQPGTPSGPGAVTSTVTHYTSTPGRARTQKLMPHTQAKLFVWPRQGLNPRAHAAHPGGGGQLHHPPPPDRVEVNWAASGRDQCLPRQKRWGLRDRFGMRMVTSSSTKCDSREVPATSAWNRASVVVAPHWVPHSQGRGWFLYVTQ